MTSPVVADRRRRKPLGTGPRNPWFSPSPDKRFSRRDAETQSRRAAENKGENAASLRLCVSLPAMLCIENSA